MTVFKVRHDERASLPTSSVIPHLMRNLKKQDEIAGQARNDGGRGEEF